MTLFFSFSSSRNHSSPSSTDIYTFICVTKPLKSFPICFRFCALPAFQSLKSKLLDPPGFAPRFRFSSFEASNSILTFHVLRGIEFYFEEEKEKHFCFSIRLSYSASIKTDSSVCITRKKQGENSDKKERNYIISDYFFPRLTPTLLLRVPVNLHEFSSPIYSLSQKHTILSFKYSLSLSNLHTHTNTFYFISFVYQLFSAHGFSLVEVPAIISRDRCQQK